MKMPKSTHRSTLRAQKGCTKREILEVLSARTDFCYLSYVPARDYTDLKSWIMNTPGQNVNDVAELVFDMMFHSEFEVTGRKCAFHATPS